MVNVRPSFVILILEGLRVRAESTPSKTADGENIFPERNLHIFLVDVWHCDGKQKTRIVFLDRNIGIVVQKGIRVVCRRHTIQLICCHACSIRFGRTIVQYFYRKRAGLADTHYLAYKVKIRES